MQSAQQFSQLVNVLSASEMWQFAVYNCKLNTFGFWAIYWTKQAIYFFWHFTDWTINQLMRRKIIALEVRCSDLINFWKVRSTLRRWLQYRKKGTFYTSVMVESILAGRNGYRVRDTSCTPHTRSCGGQHQRYERSAWLTTEIKVTCLHAKEKAIKTKP